MSENQSYDFGIKNFIRLLIRQFGVIVGVNLLMTLTMITILGIPASFAAGASVFIKLFRDEPCPVRDQYFSVFKREFRRSLGAGFAVLLMIPLALYVAFVYYRVGAGNPLLTAASVACLSIAIVWLTVSFYLWVGLAAVDLPVRALFKKQPADGVPTSGGKYSRRFRDADNRLRLWKEPAPFRRLRPVFLLRVDAFYFKLRRLRRHLEIRPDCGRTR